jgi:CO/xanthine dehydrogenase FAD-binding subunit
MEEAVQLLSRQTPTTYSLGGGSVLNQIKNDQFAVVDLQDLGLDKIEQDKNSLRIGATVTLDRLMTCEGIPPALGTAIRYEASYNIRQIATVAGSIIAGDGRSPFVTAMLALNAQIRFVPDDEVLSLGNHLPFRKEKSKGRLITQIVIPTNIKLAYQYIARTPADLPIVCVSVAQWPSRRTRVALGGYGTSPLLAFDGPDEIGAIVAARDAYEESSDSWASAEYRSDVAAILVNRCMEEIKN